MRLSYCSRTAFIPISACLTLFTSQFWLLLAVLCYLRDKVGLVKQVKDAGPDPDTYPQSGLACTRSVTWKCTKKCTCTLRNTQTEEKQRKNLAKKQHFQPSHHISTQVCGFITEVQMFSRPKSLKFGNLQI